MRWISIFLLFLCIGCDGSKDNQPLELKQPATIDDGWDTAMPADVGIDEQPLLDMVQMLINRSSSHEVHSVLIIKDGLLVFETYFKGHDYCFRCENHHGPIVQWDMDRKHRMHSVTKTYTATLVGIALDQDAISSVDENMTDYMTAYAELWVGDKTAISIKDLLTMRSGLRWDEKSTPYYHPDNDLGKMVIADDPLHYIASRNMSEAPGTVFNYSGGDTNLLGQVIRQATGKSVTDFANEFLFEPMEMEPVDWTILGGDVEYLSAGLELTPREMAKLGWIFVNDGFWKNNRIISPDWIEQATRTHVAVDTEYFTNSGYGFQWWTRTFQTGENTVDAFIAMGWGNQRIMCLPEIDTVVVFTGGNYGGRHTIKPVKLMEEYITAALQ